MDSSGLDLSALAQHFEVHNRSESKSPRTIEWYNQALELLRNDVHLQDRYIKVLGKMRRAIIRLYEVQSCRAKTLAIGVRKSV